MTFPAARTNPGGDFLDHGCASEGQQSFVAPHAAAGSPNQNEACSTHEMILATSGHIVLSNKKVYICFLTGFCHGGRLPQSRRRGELCHNAPAPLSIKHRWCGRSTHRKTSAQRGGFLATGAHKDRAARKRRGADLNAIVEKAARAHEVDPLLVHSIIKVESNYNVHAVSNKGAEGLMQLTPSTARMLGVSNSFDPQQNIEAGVKYLKYLKDLYKDDRLALAAYNAGPGAVDKYKWIPPYAETQNYVYQVGKRYGEARRAADAAKSRWK